MKHLLLNLLCWLLGHRWSEVTLVERPRGLWHSVPVPGATCERCGITSY